MAERIVMSRGEAGRWNAQNYYSKLWKNAQLSWRTRVHVNFGADDQINPQNPFYHRTDTHPRIRVRNTEALKKLKTLELLH